MGRGLALWSRCNGQTEVFVSHGHVEGGGKRGSYVDDFTTTDAAAGALAEFAGEDDAVELVVARDVSFEVEDSRGRTYEVWSEVIVSYCGCHEEVR
jgi:hypothetical protein